MKRVAILISGSGSNMRRLVEDMTGDHPARPVLVLSNDPQAGGLGLASKRGIATAAIDHRAYAGDRSRFEAAMLEPLRAAMPDIICLAGFMRILTAEFVENFSDRMLNIHPSLLPRYPGLNTHERAILAGDKEAGATVHVVTPELDCGPILGQVRVPIEDQDTAQTLAQRVLKREHQLYPAVLRRFAAGDRTPVMLGPDASPQNA